MSVIEAVVGVPPYRMLIPAGWERLPADRETIAKLTRQSSTIFKSQHRPDLDSEFARLMGVAARKMKQGGVFALYLQTSVPEEEVLPMSISASIVRGRLGGTLDRQVAALLRENGAGFLTDDRRILRWVSDTTQSREFAGITTRVLDYLISIPGRERREAVQFTTTLPYPSTEFSGDSSAAVLLNQMELLSDTVISTFTWEPSGHMTSVS